MDTKYEHIIFFDGICHLCQRSVNFVLKYDKHEKYYFSSLQSELASDLLKLQPDKNATSDEASFTTIVYYNKGKQLAKSDAVLQILTGLGGLWRIHQIWYVFPRFFRDWVYDWVSKNRYRWFGQSALCDRLNVQKYAHRIIQ